MVFSLENFVPVTFMDYSEDFCTIEKPSQVKKMSYMKEAREASKSPKPTQDSTVRKSPTRCLFSEKERKRTTKLFEKLEKLAPEPSTELETLMRKSR
jgi:hypothetical protein